MPEPVKVMVRDELLYGPPSEQEVLALFFPTQTITARQLIRQRVSQEVQAYNQHRSNLFRGLVAPAGAEQVKGGFRLPARRTVDLEKQVALACQAFERNGFLLMVDERQVTGLDEPITLEADSSVVFLKLTPLVGG